MKYKAWEIWLAQVRFEDSSQIKLRPVLVVPDGHGSFLMVKMTKSEPRSQYEHRITEWQWSGLSYETIIRTGKFLSLGEPDMIHKLGDLHPVDVTGFQTKLIAYINRGF